MGQMCAWSFMEGGSQCGMVEKIALNPISYIVYTFLHVGAWDGTTCVHSAAIKGGSQCDIVEKNCSQPELLHC